ncbi:zinc ribbon domain-containing protein [Pusillimonas sp. TS35]|uniref:FmdB family zinc ribbon protein n=1 Tax=Paracandidimonas lactea TaxID=2895524 RepID=UPI00136AF3D9|nr:zinc ribbon domain-containing protein [Pusillimonas sp. TS35]
MPIYAYKCTACGHAQDVLQKISDPVLTVCPECGQSTYAKQVTAAGFQLKGSGWYVTDFRNNGSKGTSASSSATEGGASAGSTASDASASSAPSTSSSAGTTA